MNISRELLHDFRQDHAVIGGGFGNLSAALRAGDMDKAVNFAQAMNLKAGAHIAFEEKDFYPKLVELLGEKQVDRLYREHLVGFEVIQELIGKPDKKHLQPETIRRLLGDAERMEQHIAECHDLFQAMARLSTEEQSKLLERLRYWQEENPTWQDVVARRAAQR